MVSILTRYAVNRLLACTFHEIQCISSRIFHVLTVYVSIKSVGNKSKLSMHSHLLITLLNFTPTTVIQWKVSSTATNKSFLHESSLLNQMPCNDW
uniref:AlNc14C61G4462 protein n=1 Tax=Albugo laibachii Nc14 TaxID=890382 RepID=F0WCT6_9STRA|nr:AlNc14C61G4462 [Albugo laibachii Nc14]|eukprot:CCA19005.1 AlNc14C61G4462 [Albugo laibachii Nc14]